MKPAKVIALSAIIGAFIAIFLTIGSFFETLSLSCVFLASLCVLLPLTKDSFWGSVMSVIAGSLVSLIISPYAFKITLPFLMFFGVHPIINRLQVIKNWNRWLVFIIKDIWFVGVLFIWYFLIDYFVIEIEIINRFIVPVIIIGGSLFFFVYDIMFFRFQFYMGKIAQRLKL